MTTTVPQTRIDPLHAFVAGAFAAHSKHPLPLIDTKFDVAIDGGLAVVTTARTFRNAETQPIEATITFPVPVHATLFELTARIGGRTLAARARRKEEARESYESAIDRGKTAVLHEEVLRGVHMLSVGQLGPGAEIEVEARFAVALSNVGGRGTLRIPLTVGDIYGRSPLHDSDSLTSAGAGALARLHVACADGTVTLAGGTLAEGSAWVPLAAPIDLAVTGWSAKDLPGRAADGRQVSLRIAPAPSTDAALDLALLIDRSGSMAEPCAEGGHHITKHMAVVQGLETIARELVASDRIDVWQFNEILTHVAVTGGGTDASDGGLRTLLPHLPGPAGGTEVGAALEGVIAQSMARDVLLITDGKSYALDVHRLAQRGRRVCVVLVGEDSLEANVGHLAALTDGEIFVATGLDLESALRAAFRALRVPRAAPAAVSDPVQQVLVTRAGMVVAARWSETEGAGEARAVAAFAASLALPLLPADAAAKLAEAEGLVSHLTSLVLVDEAMQGDIVVPATRKVPLPEPRTAAAAPPRMMMLCLPEEPSPSFAEMVEEHEFRRALGKDAKRRSEQEAVRRAEQPRPRSGLPVEKRKRSGLFASWRKPTPRLRDLAAQIDWNTVPAELQAGDLSSLDAATARALRDAAAQTDVTALAAQLGFDPMVLLIGLLARVASSYSRSAARIVRAILSTLPDAEIETAAKRLDLA